MSDQAIPEVNLPDGTLLPAIGQGTWNIGDEPFKKREEIRTLRRGIELGLRVIDTAEMYGDGRSEALVGEAIRGMRDDVFLVSKVYPHNAGLARIERSCEDSLKRLGTDRLDLYLLHWRGSVPLSETIRGMQRLMDAGKIVRWGVSNFDTDDMEELLGLEGGSACSINQVLYHLGSRGIEYDLLPWQRGHRMPVMAYSPLAQAGMLRSGLIRSAAVREVAERHEASPFQILLTWCIREGGILAIPKASSEEHAAQNAGAGAIRLTAEDIAVLETAYPKPLRKVPLDII